MDYSKLLNARQLEAVTSDSKYLRIIAGAGSGKTRVLTYRIAYLIENRHVDPSKILAITFTNKVANEMQERASRLVRDFADVHGTLHIMTFHSFAARFLRIEADAIGYPRSFTIFDEDDQSKLVRTIGEKKGYSKGDKVIKDALSYIRRKKGEGKYPQDISDHELFTHQFKLFRDFYFEYEEEKRKMYCLDFDDLLLQTLGILKHRDDIREKWQRRFEHVLVDEFQDTNDVQFELMKLLLGPDTAVYVVGDPDQTIYTWRGANQRIIMAFDATFKGAETVVLDRNYRSTKTILDAANKLIANNKKRVPKNLYTEEGDGDPITTYNAYSSEKEAEWVCRNIHDLAMRQQDERGEPLYSNIALLYRSSYQTRAFELALAKSGIPYRIFGGLRFYERMEVKDLLAFCRLMLNPLDNVSFERIVNVPRRGIGDSTLAKIRQESSDLGLSELNYLYEFEKYAGGSDIPHRAYIALLPLLTELQRARDRLTAKEETYASILRDFVDKIHYNEFLKEMEEEDEDRIENINALFEDIDHFQKNSPDMEFAEYLQNVSLYSAQDDMNGGNYVSLMTIHVAKGLEFDYVFIISATDGAFPSRRALEETDRDGEEEERRLAYVALTRAKKKLFMSANQSYSYSSDGQTIPSRYFKEAGIPIKTPDSMSRGSMYGGFYQRKGGTSVPYFSDGSHIDPFENEAPKPKVPEGPKDNGIKDWKVGDLVNHETFGTGTVTKLIDDKIIEIRFDSGSTKVLLGSHPKLSRTKSKGGEA